MAEDYTVEQGDCISSIAFEHGFFWETLWNDSSNADLKSKRKDPNVLMEGDIVHIPDLRLKKESGATEQKHKFKLKGVPAKLKLKLMRPKPPKDTPEQAPGGSGGSADESEFSDADFQAAQGDEEEPMANAPYVLEADGVRIKEGKTDGDGCVEIPIPPNASQGKLTVNKDKPDEKIIYLDLGGMDPVDEPTGVRKRLNNLGYPCDDDGPLDADDLQVALAQFQDDNGLTVSGTLDDPTKDKLKDLHGC